MATEAKQAKVDGKNNHEGGDEQTGKTSFYACENLINGRTSVLIHLVHSVFCFSPLIEPAHMHIVCNKWNKWETREFSWLRTAHSSCWR